MGTVWAYFLNKQIAWSFSLLCQVSLKSACNVSWLIHAVRSISAQCHCFRQQPDGLGSQSQGCHSLRFAWKWRHFIICLLTRLLVWEAVSHKLLPFFCKRKVQEKKSSKLVCFFPVFHTHLWSCHPINARVPICMFGIEPNNCYVENFKRKVEPKLYL